MELYTELSQIADQIRALESRIMALKYEAEEVDADAFENLEAADTDLGSAARNVTRAMYELKVAEGVEVAEDIAAGVY